MIKQQQHSTSPAMDQSRPEPSSPVQSRPRKDWTVIGPIPDADRLDWAWTNPSQCPGLGYASPGISLVVGKIYLDGAGYIDRSGIMLIRVGIRGCVVIKCKDESCFW